MAQFYMRRYSKLYSPAARATSATLPIISVKKGDRIVFGHVQLRALSTTANTIALRVATAGGGAAGGLLAALDSSAGTVGDMVNLAGADLLTAGGYLVTADSTIDAVYVAVGGGGTVTPVWDVEIAIIKRTATN